MSSVVSAITGQRGGNSGGAGLNYNADTASLLNPTTQVQADDLYGQAKNTLNNQNNFLAAVQAQNGLQNQSNVYNQLQGVANGTGPNPAQNALNQATGANVANQAALMAGQRGSSTNPGMIGRQVAQQGANIQQQAAGQSATMQSQQQLNALNQMGGLATNQANQQANATNALTNATQAEQGQILGAIQGQNNANVGMTSNRNSANAGISAVAAQGQQNLIGGIVGGVGSAFGLAEGGPVPHAQPQMFAQGSTGVTALETSQGATSGPKSNVGKWFQDNPNVLGGGGQDSSKLAGTALAGNTMGKGLGKGIKNLFGPSSMDGTQTGGLDSNIGSKMGNTVEAFAIGGKVPAMVSPGEHYLSPNDMDKVKAGADPLKVGERIPGEPKFKGNNYSNDVVPKTLEEGGVVIPNSVMEQPKSVRDKKAEKFVHQYLASGGRVKGMVIFSSKKGHK